MVSDPVLDRNRQAERLEPPRRASAHKPLLLLLALGRLSRGEASLPFAECEGKLSELLREFGPGRRSVHPEYPFWRLQNDGLWVVSATEALQPRQSNSDPPKTELREKNAVGRFPEDMRARLQANPSLVSAVAQRLLQDHFPETLHQDILDAVGLSLERGSNRRKPRDPRFRTRVLTAYGYRCAMCGLDLRMGNVTIALEAAHIQWHQAGGPDTEENGVALCSLHHKVFDLGAFTIHTDYRVLVSETANGSGQFEQVLLRHHGEPIGRPTRPEYAPALQFLGWHRREVFKEAARFLEGVV